MNTFKTALVIMFIAYVCTSDKQSFEEIIDDTDFAVFSLEVQPKLLYKGSEVKVRALKCTDEDNCYLTLTIGESGYTSKKDIPRATYDELKAFFKRNEVNYKHNLQFLEENN